MRQKLFAVAMLAFAGCASGNPFQSTVPGLSQGPRVSMLQDSCAKPADLKQFDPSADDEYHLGRAAASEVLARYGTNALLSQDDPRVAYVSRVGNVVALTASEHRNDPALNHLYEDRLVPDREWPLRGYHFLVVDTAAVNAQGMPGGYVVLTTGLLKLVKTEDELALVLAHEIAHVQRGHGVELVKKSVCRAQHQDEGISGSVRTQLSQTARQMQNSSVATMGIHVDAIMQKGIDGAFGAIENFTTNSYARPLEMEADRLAATYASYAGYRAGGLIGVLQRLPPASALDHLGCSVLSTHPAPQDRVTALRDMIRRDKLVDNPSDESLRTPRFEKEMKL